MMIDAAATATAFFIMFAPCHYFIWSMGICRYFAFACLILIMKQPLIIIIEVHFFCSIYWVCLFNHHPPITLHTHHSPFSHSHLASLSLYLHHICIPLFLLHSLSRMHSFFFNIRIEGDEGGEREDCWLVYKKGERD